MVSLEMYVLVCCRWSLWFVRCRSVIVLAIRFTAIMKRVEFIYKFILLAHVCSCITIFCNLILVPYVGSLDCAGGVFVRLCFFVHTQGHPLRWFCPPPPPHNHTCLFLLRLTNGPPFTPFCLIFFRYYYYGNEGGGTLHPKDTFVAICIIEKKTSLNLYELNATRLLKEGCC